MQQDYIIGVDAGGTGTHAVAYAADGSTLGSVRTAHGNLALDFEAAQDHIRKAIDTLRDTTPGALRGICIGCAGADTGDGRERLLQSLQTDYPCEIRVINDALLALIAAHGASDGILVIAGTGSIAYRRRGDAYRRCGGWGHLIGDGGSGYDIAMQAIRHVTALHDRALPPDALQNALFDALGIDALPALIAFVYRASKADIAALCPIVLACAADGCPVSADILTRAGQTLAQDVLCLCDDLHAGDAPVPVALSGSVLTHAKAVQESFSRALCASGLPLTLLPSTPDPTYGAYRAFYENAREVKN